MPAIPSRRALGPPWSEEVVLADGRALHIRPIRADDAEALRRGFSLLEPEEIRLRFMHPMRELTPELARRLSTIDTRSDFALIACEPPTHGQPSPPIVAVVRASIQTDRRRAEYAIIVAHPFAGLGLGRHLMRRVIRWAQYRRLDEIFGDVLDENTAMLALADSLGFRRDRAPGEPGVIRVRLPLKRASTTR